MLKLSLRTIVKKVLFASLYAALGGFATLVLAVVLLLDNRPDLKVWHEVYLDAEYTADSPVTDWKGYLALEDRLFQQLDNLVLDRVPPTERGPIQRYHRDSLSDPGRWKRNWNRSFEFANSKPTAGVLLLHGMSDSPYSLRSLGTRLN